MTVFRILAGCPSINPKNVTLDKKGGVRVWHYLSGKKPNKRMKGELAKMSDFQWQKQWKSSKYLDLKSYKLMKTVKNSKNGFFNILIQNSRMEHCGDVTKVRCEPTTDKITTLVENTNWSPRYFISDERLAWNHCGIFMSLNLKGAHDYFSTEDNKSFSFIFCQVWF